MQELREGTRLADRYALKKRLGAGGMADIWLARDERAASTVALKILKETLAGDAAQRDLFRREWAIASRLMHANIVRVFEYHDGDRPFYAQHFIDGPDIGELAGRDPATFLPAVGALADALRYAHAKDIVHRDIKASNVLLDGGGAPCLIDFGSANTRGGGTEVCQSPQQRAGEPPSSADDIYSLGVMLHELMTGRPPGDEVPKLVSPDGNDVADDISDLVAAMLANEAAARPSAERVRDRLAEAGYAAGPARLPPELRRARAVAAEDDRPIEQVLRPARPVARGEAPRGARRDERQGVSARVVYAGLAVLLLALIAVTLLLPDAVQRDDTETVAGTDASETAAADSGSMDLPTDSSPGGESAAATPPSGVDGGRAGFSENLAPTSTDARIRAKLEADEALGDLLSQHERLKYRGIERWGGQPYQDALTVYAQGDEAYINDNYTTAAERYRQTLDRLQPFFDRIDSEFRRAMAEAEAAFERRDPVEAVRLYDLAVAITPGHAGAEQGLERARKLGDVLNLMQQGRRYLDELELEAARIAFEQALALDPLWEPAREALESVRAEITQQSFESRMTEGFSALAAEDFQTARAAFEAASRIYPQSQEPKDGLLQVDQEERLYRIARMEREARAQEDSEQWETAVATYEALLEVDGDLVFAKDGLARARQRAALHQKLQDYIDDPDSLSDPVNMRNATQLMLGISRMENVGPRLEDHKEVLARLLKRAATPLTVELVSDNATEVSVYQVGKLGQFDRRRLELRPGSYVAVGIRPGYRDVRREFRVAPEIDMEPIVVQCEEPI